MAYAIHPCSHRMDPGAGGICPRLLTLLEDLMLRNRESLKKERVGVAFFPSVSSV